MLFELFSYMFTNENVGLEILSLKFRCLQIDLINVELPELKNFVIPGGHFIVSYTHLARCTCRRAERFISELNQIESVPEIIIAYINRLSDFLFILARKLSKDHGVKEMIWSAQKK